MANVMRSHTWIISWSECSCVLALRMFLPRIGRMNFLFLHESAFLVSLLQQYVSPWLTAVAYSYVPLTIIIILNICIIYKLRKAKESLGKVTGVKKDENYSRKVRKLMCMRIFSLSFPSCKQNWWGTIAGDRDSPGGVRLIHVADGSRHSLVHRPVCRGKLLTTRYKINTFPSYRSQRLHDLSKQNQNSAALLSQSLYFDQRREEL